MSIVYKSLQEKETKLADIMLKYNEMENKLKEMEHINSLLEEEKDNAMDQYKESKVQLDEINQELTLLRIENEELTSEKAALTTTMRNNSRVVSNQSNSEQANRNNDNTSLRTQNDPNKKKDEAINKEKWREERALERRRERESRKASRGFGSSIPRKT